MNKKSDDKKMNQMPSEFKISYTNGGGFTSCYSEFLTRKFTIDQNGKVKIELVIENSLVKPMEYKVGKDKATNLMKFFYENKFDELPEDLSDQFITDCPTSYLEVSSNTINRKVGGYAAFQHSEFTKFVNQFRTIINNDINNSFDNKVRKQYEQYEPANKKHSCIII